MRTSKFTDPQIVAILREAEGDDVTVEATCLKYAITPTPFYRWKKSFGVGGAQLAETRRLKELEVENARLKRLSPSRCSRSRCSRRSTQKNGERVGSTRAGALRDESRVRVESGVRAGRDPALGARLRGEDAGS